MDVVDKSEKAAVDNVKLITKSIGGLLGQKK
jgi:hypothetical protein